MSELFDFLEMGMVYLFFGGLIVLILESFQWLASKQAERQDDEKEALKSKEHRKIYEEKLTKRENSWKEWVSFTVGLIITAWIVMFVLWWTTG